MDIKQILKNLIYYYNSRRGVGHTTITVLGIDRESILICDNLENGEAIRKTFKLTNVCIQSIDKLQLQGLTLPLIFDNKALNSLFYFSYIEIERLENKVKNLEKRNNLNEIF